MVREYNECWKTTWENMHSSLDLLINFVGNCVKFNSGGHRIAHFSFFYEIKIKNKTSWTQRISQKQVR